MILIGPFIRPHNGIHAKKNLARVDMNVVPRSTRNTNSGTEN